MKKENDQYQQWRNVSTKGAVIAVAILINGNRIEEEKRRKRISEYEIMIMA